MWIFNKQHDLNQGKEIEVKIDVVSCNVCGCIIERTESQNMHKPYYGEISFCKIHRRNYNRITTTGWLPELVFHYWKEVECDESGKIINKIK